MSPILEISLVIILLLWVIPLTWALSTNLRALPRSIRALIDFVRHGPSSISMSRDLQIKLEQAYQDLQSNLIQVRAACSSAIEDKKTLLIKIQVLSEEICAFETIPEPTDIQRQKKGVAREKLSQLERELRDLEYTLDSLRQRLTDLEAEVQKAYTRKQVLIARDKAAIATENAYKILAATDKSAIDVIQRMELKVKQNEAQAYGATFITLASVRHYQEFVDSVCKLPFATLNVDELEEVTQAIVEVIGDIKETTLETAAAEELLSVQLDSADEDYRYWVKRAAAAEQDGMSIPKKEAEVNLFDCEVRVQKAKLQLEEARKITTELKQMEMKLHNKKREINVRLTSFESENADPAPGE